MAEETPSSPPGSPTNPFGGAQVLRWEPPSNGTTSNAVADPPAMPVAVEPEPVEPAAPEDISTEEPPAPDEGVEEQEESGEVAPTARRPIQPRISELTQQRNAAQTAHAEAEGRARALQSELDYWKSQALHPPPAPEVPQAPPDGLQRTPQGRPLRPVEAAYATTQEYDQAVMQYEDALLQWHGQQVVTAYDQQRQAADSLARAREKYQDFEQVIRNSRVAVNDHVGQAIQASRMQHDLLYHLATHPDVAQSLASVHGPAAYLAIAELQVQLRQPPAPAPPVPVDAGEPPPPPPAAPPPIPPPRGRSVPVPQGYEGLSFVDFKKKRDQEEAEARRIR